MGLFTVILAALGLGLLVFIHELGHYFMAKRVGITVEVFSIGFGRPVFRWMRGDVEWRIGWLPFGGYVRMAGMDKKEDKQPYEVEGGFFHASPWSRIKVALAGPAVNIVFAFLVFCLIWALGGRDKPFAELTDRVGWVDEQSALYAAGVRPGDEITSYNGRPLESSQDHLYAAMLSSGAVDVQGEKINYKTGQKVPFQIDAVPYPFPGMEEGILTLGVLQPAQYLLYVQGDDVPESVRNSGIKPGDRLLWVDGDLLFSNSQLSYLLNQERALVTALRDGQEIMRRVPRVLVTDLRLTPAMHDEISDWEWAAKLGKSSDTRFIPYDITPEGVVEGRLSFVDADEEGEWFPKELFSEREAPLLSGDRILAVDGQAVTNGAEILKQLQTRQVNLMVQRQANWPVVSWKQADANFDQTTIDANAIALNPITPVSRGELLEGHPEWHQWEAEIAAIQDPQLREEARTQFEEQRDLLVLGVSLEGRQVAYNPLPTTQFANTIAETGRTLKALVTGTLSPKFLSGPVGIVQVMHIGWSIGFKEALFWLAVISLNLGLLNLLPIPVLDGGHVCFCLWEMITKKRIKAETMEKLVIPFVVLMIGFFIFVTYQDLSRLLRNFF